MKWHNCCTPRPSRGPSGVQRQIQGTPRYKVQRRAEEMPLCPGCWLATPTARSIQLYLKYTLSLQVGVCIVAPKALRMLAHVAPFRARLRRWDQPGEHTLVATNRSLGSIAQAWGEVCGVARRRHSHSPVEMGGWKVSVLRPRAVVGGHGFTGRVTVGGEPLTVVRVTGKLLTKSSQSSSIKVLLQFIQVGQRILVERRVLGAVGVLVAQVVIWL